MGSIKIAGKNIVTQSGSDEPTIASNVVFPSGHVLQVQSTNWSNTNQIGDAGAITETLSYDNNSLTPLSEVTITPINANSFFYITLSGRFGINSGYRSAML